MYTSFFGLKEKPFSLVPNPSYLFLSRQHENALTYLEYGLHENVGFVMLTGDIGTGKTTLLRHMLNTMRPEVNTAVLFNTSLVSDELVPLILDRFGAQAGTSASKVQALEILNEFLITQYAAGKKMLLIIDEAQNLSRDALEEIRMISNLQTDDELLLQVMIVGQPELRKKIQDPALEQFAQRIAASYHLTAMDADETRDYIAHRLETAGGSPVLFTPDAVEKIFDVSKGVPRTINLICDAALVYGYADETTAIDSDVIHQVVRDKGGIGLVDRKASEQTSQTDVHTMDERLSRIEVQIASLNQKMDLLLKTMDAQYQIKTSA